MVHVLFCMHLEVWGLAAFVFFVYTVQLCKEIQVFQVTESGRVFGVSQNCLLQLLFVDMCLNLCMQSMMDTHKEKPVKLSHNLPYVCRLMQWPIDQLEG